MILNVLKKYDGGVYIVCSRRLEVGDFKKKIVKRREYKKVRYSHLSEQELDSIR